MNLCQTTGQNPARTSHKNWVRAQTCCLCLKQEAGSAPSSCLSRRNPAASQPSADLALPLPRGSKSSLRAQVGVTLQDNLPQPPKLVPALPAAKEALSMSPTMKAAPKIHIPWALLRPNTCISKKDQPQTLGPASNQQTHKWLQ